ncbi:hypothetical protein FHL15_008135 [Xylaria flabelliformis]|uniref:Uncharacterized protein n=1 Tax=Xylaria flabelliformis TaxID=2512241 RepID=A0A553HSJ6_9PEZI|nr:hypothetical protein FHL15_008135 [Xylaria flabelliformis]
MTAITPPLAALTTVFTPPCPITWLLTTTKVPSQFPPFPTTAPASCDPPSWGEYVSERGFEYYSPAICPSGFFVGPSCIITNPRTAQGFPVIQAGETAAYCIPNGHTCTSDTSDFRGGVWGVSRTASANGAQVTVGPAIQIRWRAEDLDGLETDPLTPGARTTAADLLPTETTESEVTPTITSEPETTSTEEPLISLTSSSTQLTTARVIQPISSGFKTVPLTSTSTSTSLSPPLLPSSPSAPSSSEIPHLPSSSTQESQTSPTPSPSATQLGGQAASAQESQDKNNNKSPSSNFTVAAIILTAILISLLAGYGAYSIIRQYRRYKAGETKEFVGFRIEAWIWRFFDNRRRKKNMAAAAAAAAMRDEKPKRRKLPDAELGTEGPLTELGDTKPFGTMENPAELPTPTTPTKTTTTERTERWSWRSRVSRMLTVRSTKDGPVTSAA